MIHTILGAGGPVSNAVRQELEAQGKQVRLASRRTIATQGATRWIKTDLLVKEEVMEVVKGSDVVYLCAGLRYEKEVWAQEWPVLMKNVIEACKQADARLIFFDNVYMYGRVQGPMTENTPNRPSSVKGEIRAKIAESLMQEIKAGRLKGSIARAADFYGSESLNSFFDFMVLAKFAKKEKAMWMGDPNTLHSFTYVPDAAKAMAILGDLPSSDGQIWHLPTAKPQTGKAFLEMAAKQFHVHNKYMKVNKLLLKSLGIFMKIMREMVEMYYQYEFDYHFNSDKFEKTFGFVPTPYQKGIEEISCTFLNKEQEGTIVNRI